MESLLRNVCVPPLTSREMAIVFTRSGFFLVKAVFLLNETETSKINAKFVLLFAVYVEKEKLVVLSLRRLRTTDCRPGIKCRVCVKMINTVCYVLSLSGNRKID